MTEPKIKSSRLLINPELKEYDNCIQYFRDIWIAMSTTEDGLMKRWQHMDGMTRALCMVNFLREIDEQVNDPETELNPFQTFKELVKSLSPKYFAPGVVGITNAYLYNLYQDQFFKTFEVTGLGDKVDGAVEKYMEVFEWYCTIDAVHGNKLAKLHQRIGLNKKNTLKVILEHHVSTMKEAQLLWDSMVLPRHDLGSYQEIRETFLTPYSGNLPAMIRRWMVHASD